MQENGRERFPVVKMVVLAFMLAVTLISWFLADRIYGEGSVFNAAPTGIDSVDAIYQSMPEVIDCIRLVFLLYVFTKVIQFVVTRTISAFHHRYDRVTLQVTTLYGNEIMEEYVRHFRHGISCVDAVGGYSRRPMCLLHTVVSSYEQADVIHLMREVDPHVIINVFKTDQFFGKFYQAPIE